MTVGASVTGKRPYPELVVVVASSAWGLFWIPLRAFQSQGLDPAWATLAQFATPLIALIPLAVFRLTRRLPIGVGEYRTGLLVGTAVALYLYSLLLTEVAQALILFYAMPAWGTIIEVGLMRRPFTKWRGIALALSLLGMLAILSPFWGSPASGNIGDLMALLSGIVFAFGAMQIRRTPQTAVFEQVFAFFLYGLAAALVLTLFPPTGVGRPPKPGQWVTLAPWLMLVAVGFLIPIMSGIYWGSRHVDPGRLGILLQMEAVVGIISAALFAGEPFGPRQAVGAAFVIGAGIVEVIGDRERSREGAGPSRSRG